MTARTLVVNADDFGYSEGVNRGIIESHVFGIVTSTSAIVDAASMRDLKTVSQFPSLSLGLHFCISDPGLERSLLSRDPLDESQVHFLEHELVRQLEVFEQAVGRQPTHFDSHHHIHLHPQIEKLLHTTALSHLPRRGINRMSVVSRFYAGRNASATNHIAQVSVATLLAILSELPQGASELICHPGYADHSLLNKSRYAAPREAELRTLCDNRVREFLQYAGIVLANRSQVDQSEEQLTSYV